MDDHILGLQMVEDNKGGAGGGMGKSETNCTHNYDSTRAERKSLERVSEHVTYVNVFVAVKR